MPTPRLAKTVREIEQRFPAGNAKVGDRGRIRITEGKTWCPLTVIETGLPGANGLYLTIKVRLEMEGNPEWEIACSGTKENPLVLYPPPAEIPQEVRAWARKNFVTVIRLRDNTDEPRYEFIRWDSEMKKYWRVTLEMTMTETADLFWDDGKFCSGKPCMEDSGTEVVIVKHDQDSVETKVLELPDELEHYC